MEVQTYTIAILSFKAETNIESVVGYLNIPPCNKDSKQFPIIQKDNRLVCIYNEEEKNIEAHLSIEDRFKVNQILDINNWEVQSNSVVVELIDWDKFLVKKRKKHISN
ncbi:hypothetical protein [Staphylococcus saprophyticus]|uniref:hypothetical protein n=1 Tax=Staphylococcus saprophyticus TaxID=29385 RepID=UPI0034C646DF